MVRTALGVLARSNTRVARHIPATGFIGMLNSGSWTDRNKAGFLLDELSQRRDPKLLKQLRSKALGSLIEMARWRFAGHSDFARILRAELPALTKAGCSSL